MADRMQLNEQDMEDVVGGRFSFYEDENGNYVCKVTTTGHTYQTSEFGSTLYRKLRMANPGLSEAEYESLCKEKHIIW